RTGYPVRWFQLNRHLAPAGAASHTAQRICCGRGMFIFRSARGDNARHRLNKRHPARHVSVIGSLDPQTGALLPLMATTPSPETRVHARQLRMFKVPANGVTTSFTFVGHL